MSSTFSDILNSTTPTLLDFTAEWCGPCKMMKPVLEELKNSIGDKARILKIDIDKNPRVADKYKVQSVPTLILFKNGKILWRQSGVQTVPALKKVIEQHLN